MTFLQIRLKHFKDNLPSDFWKLIIWFISERSKLFIQEMMVQINYAKKCYENYEISKNKNNIKDIFFHIHHFVVHASNVDKLLDKLHEPSNSLQAKLLDTIFDFKSINLKNIRELRNHLEHFEERLDVWSYLNLGNTLLDMNIIDTHTRGINKEKCLRLLVLDKNEFIILGERYKLDVLNHQIEMIHDRLNEYLILSKG